LKNVKKTISISTSFSCSQTQISSVVLHSFFSDGEKKNDSNCAGGFAAADVIGVPRTDDKRDGGNGVSIYYKVSSGKEMRSSRGQKTNTYGFRGVLFYGTAGREEIVARFKQLGLWRR
jgi:hypothetical protein